MNRDPDRDFDTIWYNSAVSLGSNLVWSEGLNIFFIFEN
jgi:hypothetical protein